MTETAITPLVSVEDIEWADGNTGAEETFIRRTSTGGLLTVTKLDATHLKFRNHPGSVEDLWNGTVIDPGVLPIDTDGTFAANSDDVVPSQKAAKTYVDTAISTAVGDITTLELDPAIADHAYSGSYFTATAGENLAIGAVCYRKSDGKYWKAQADADTTMPGVVIATATISADATGVFLQKGFIRDDSGWGGALTVGGLLYVSEATAGLATQARPSTTTNQVQVIGYAYAARIVWFDPNLILVEVP